MYDLNRWIFEIPLEDIQDPDKEDMGKEPCICCGKDTKKPKYWVHVVAGNLVSTADAFGDDEDMGFYPIGPKCKNKLPNNFYFKDAE